MKGSIRSLLFIITVTITIIMAMQVWNTINWARYDNKIKQQHQEKATVETKALLDKVELLLAEVDQCYQQECILDSSHLSAVNHQLQHFTSAVSQEKSSVNLVGAVEYTQLKVALSKYSKEKNISSLLSDLTPIYIELQHTYQTLLKIQIQNVNQTQSKKFYLSLMLFIALLLVALLSITLYSRRITRLNKEYDIENRQFERFANQVNELTTQNLEEKINQLGISINERKLYSHILELYRQTESERKNSDLYRQLYTLIGYEIRGITNTIEGGVKLLVQDTDENGAVMAKEISSATTTLSELADNYNELITQGSAERKNASLTSLLSVLIVHIKAKAQRQQIQVECYIEDNLPNTIDTSATSLFWVLFLQLSNAMTLVDCSKILLHVFSLGSNEIEKTRLTFDVVFLGNKDCTLDEITSNNWQPADDQHNSQDSWSKQILSDVSFFESSWFTQNSNQKKRLQIDVTPLNFLQANSELDDKSILVCADSELQINIIQNILERYKCHVSIARTPNDVFKNLPNLSSTDAVIVTDTIKGIELRSFCKTLKSRMKNCPNTQLLLAISEASAVQSAHEFVDRIFYTPLLPHEFIPNLVEAMETEKQQEDSTQNHFLVVEDDRVQQFLLKQLLKKQDYEASTASNGEEAVDYFKKNSVDIIFMDCIMPGMGGLDATKLIRSLESEDPTRTPVTIIGATALTSANEHKACIEAGMDFVISKPYKSDEIAKVIKKYLAVHKIF
ncbi:response regulator [Vibrio sp. SCSIO 43135]|uniref:ATP-binding response regulator n=1 Tax=Vibrio sp. SCSIO 43135 TaxID=2819096 RepID=UPI002075AB63|nr:response regulator [Vibrio sp. SCSIO 43135]USD40035.1 response regulator [Vibrio sp. SCSIO 43135]